MSENEVIILFQDSGYGRKHLQKAVFYVPFSVPLLSEIKEKLHRFELQDGGRKWEQFCGNVLVNPMECSVFTNNFNTTGRDKHIEYIR